MREPVVPDVCAMAQMMFDNKAKIRVIFFIIVWFMLDVANLYKISESKNKMIKKLYDIRKIIVCKIVNKG